MPLDARFVKICSPLREPILKQPNARLGRSFQSRGKTQNFSLPLYFRRSGGGVWGTAKNIERKILVLLRRMLT
jgi:hypothetical protein